jgi:beta-lactamase class A
MAMAQRQLEDGTLKDSPELQRGLKDMIVESTNDATGYILDCITQTTSGPELSPEELKVWGEKRNAVNRFFVDLGYQNLNINQKTWNEGPYGRERQFLGPNYENRNKLTTDGTARLLAEIALGEFVSMERSRQMMELLKRDVKDEKDSQSVDFSGLALKAVPGVKLWSKAGWTSTARHDAAFVETPNGKRFVIVIFTTGVANQKEIIPFVVKEMLDGLK